MIPRGIDADFLSQDFLIVVRQTSIAQRADAMESIRRDKLDSDLPYQVAVNLSDGDGADGMLRRLYCANLNIGAGHETAIVH